MSTTQTPTTTYAICDDRISPTPDHVTLAELREYLTDTGWALDLNSLDECLPGQHLRGADGVYLRIDGEMVLIAARNVS